MRIGYLVAALVLITLVGVEAMQMEQGRTREEAVKRAVMLKRPAQAPKAMADANDPKALNRQAILLHSQNKHTDALVLYRKAISLEPRNAAYHNNIALLFKDMGLLAEAQKEAQTAIALNPKEANYYFNLGLILRKGDQLPRAQQNLARAIRLQPDDPEFRYVLGEVLLSRGKRRQAERVLKTAIELKPDEPKYRELQQSIVESRNQSVQ
jgi:Flp pilus assembly protein TadD